MSIWADERIKELLKARDEQAKQIEELNLRIDTLIAQTATAMQRQSSPSTITAPPRRN